MNKIEIWRVEGVMHPILGKCQICHVNPLTLKGVFFDKKEIRFSSLEDLKSYKKTVHYVSR